MTSIHTVFINAVNAVMLAALFGTPVQHIVSAALNTSKQRMQYTVRVDRRGLLTNRQRLHHSVAKIE